MEIGFLEIGKWFLSLIVGVATIALYLALFHYGLIFAEKLLDNTIGRLSRPLQDWVVMALFVVLVIGCLAAVTLYGQHVIEQVTAWF